MNKTLKNEITLNYHMKTIHKTKTLQKDYKCDVCDKVFQSKYQKEYHFMKEHSNRNLTCNICQLTLISPQNLRLHVNIMHLEKKDNFQCTIMKMETMF